VTLFYLSETPDSCCASFSTPLKLRGSEPGKRVVVRPSAEIKSVLIAENSFA
jgi:hypothetical protein